MMLGKNNAHSSKEYNENSFSKDCKVHRTMSGNNVTGKRKHAGESGDNRSHKKTVTTPVAAKSQFTPTTAATPEATATTRNQWKEKLDMSPPQKKIPVEGKSKVTTKKDASFDEVEAKMRADGWENLLAGDCTAATATDDQKIVHFLYGIEFCKNTSKKERVKRIKKFLGGEAKNRMMDLLKKDSDMSHCSQNIGLWRTVQAVVLRYGQEKGASTVFEGKQMPVAARTQSTKNCYQHATLGALGYKIAFDKGDNEHMVHTVDVAKAMRHHYDDDKLEKRILHNKGGQSQTLLTRMVKGTGLEIGDVLKPKRLKKAPKYLKENGPALVSRFSTDKFFKEKKGGYKCSDGTYRLVQFDRNEDKDTHTFLKLGELTPTEEDILRTMERKNKKEEPPLPASPLIHMVSKSFSTEDTTGDEEEMEPDCVLEGAGGLHAMILIGARVEDDTGKNWFLIQNTWKSLPVFEASEFYLAHHLKQSSPSGNIVFLDGVLKDDISLPLIDQQGLCLEPNDCDDMAEWDDNEEDEEDTSDSDLEEE